MIVLLATATCFGAVLQPAPPLPLPYVLPKISVRVVTSGDFDRDGRIDLLAGALKLGDPPLLLRRNDGGFFDEPSPASDGSTALGLAAVDLDDDGDLDAVQGGSVVLSVARNDGAGNFTMVNHPLPAGGPLASGDFDLDGDLDVAMAVSSQSALRFWSNDGTGVLSGAGVHTAPAPSNLAIADFDQDGLQDLAASATTTAALSLARNLGGFGFSVQAIPLAQPSSQIAARDFTADGLPDLAVTHFLSAGMSHATNLGGFAFSPASPVGTSESRLGLAILDIDGDGTADLASAGSGLVYFPGSPSGPGNACELLVEQVMILAHAADINGDARPDFVLIPQLLAHGAALVLSAPGGGFELQLRSGIGQPTTFSGAKPVAVDMDADGDSDVAFANPDGSIVVAANAGDGSFQPAFSVATGDGGMLHRPRVAVGDLDNDGQLDVAYAPSNAPTAPSLGRFWLAMRTPSGAFQAPLAIDVAGSVPEIVIEDLDLDGIADVVHGLHVPNLAFSSWDSFAVLRNLGAPTFVSFAPYFQISLGSGQNQLTSQIALVTADFTSDGFPDIAAASRLSSKTAVVANHGNGTSTTLLFLGSTSPTALAVGDLDGDGLLDLAESWDGTSTDAVRFFRGDGASLTIVGATTQLGLDDPSDLAIGDLDGDGAPEIAVPRKAADGGIDILQPGTTIPAWTRRDVLTDGYPETVAIADFDGDARVDVISTSGYQPAYVSIHRNLLGSHPFTTLGFGKPGTKGTPRMLAQGTLEAGSDGAILLRDARPNSLALVVVAVQSLPVNVLGGTLAAFPVLFTVPVSTNASGAIDFFWTQHVPASPGQSFWLQFLVADPGATHGVAFSNAIRAIQP